MNYQKDLSYLELNLPKFLIVNIDKIQEAWRVIDKGEEYSLWDCIYCELQSDINVAEIEQQISSAQANYLRKKYLRIREDEL